MISIYKVKLIFHDLNHQEYIVLTEKMAHNRDEALVEGLADDSLLKLIRQRYLKLMDWEVKTI